MRYKSFQEYLLANNLTDKLSKEQRAALQIEWRKAYQKKYQELYGHKRIRKTISLNEQEDTQLKKAAQQHNMKLNDFMKQAIFGYLNQVYVIPNEEQVQETIIQLRKIGTNINQIARHINSYQAVEQEQINLLYTLLQGMERSIESNLCKPDSLEVQLKKALESAPQYLHKIEQILKEHQAKKEEL